MFLFFFFYHFIFLAAAAFFFIICILLSAFIEEDEDDELEDEFDEAGWTPEMPLEDVEEEEELLEDPKRKITVMRPFYLSMCKAGVPKQI